MSAVSDEDLRVLRHMLGIDKPEHRDPEPYRNYYCADPGDLKLASMADRGLVALRRRPTSVYPYDTYVATEEGIRLARQSARQRAYPKAKRVYLRYLHVSDCCPDLTFREFLTSAHFAESRRLA